jgi:hypothetical protein
LDPLSIARDVAQLAILAILTFIGWGRWIEAREQTEAATDKSLLGFTRQHKEEHERLWAEMNRQRDRWHHELIPWQTEVIRRLYEADGRLDLADAAQKSQSEEIARLRNALERRRQ